MTDKKDKTTTKPIKPTEPETMQIRMLVNYCGSNKTSYDKNETVNIEASLAKSLIDRHMAKEV